MRTPFALAAVAALSGAVLAAGPTLAATLRANMALATPTGPGASVGEIVMTQGPAGVTFDLNLHDLPPGPHGFHIHVNPSCAPAVAGDKATPAGGAGGHLDPAKTGMHMGPMGEGHLGDLPRIVVAPDGTLHGEVTAERVKSLNDLKGHSLMLHVGGDNYADTPAPLGGGGARMACGVIS